LNASVVITGGVADVWAHWGPTDGGTVPGSWANSNLVGTFSTVGTNAVSYVAGNFIPETGCYFRFRITNASVTAWAPESKAFRTLSSISAYTRKLKITFNGYTKAETLTNFPALVTINESMPNVSYRQFMAGATDVRFRDEPETTELNYEIDGWNTNGTSYAWVQVPRFTNNCSIWMYWGNTNAAVAPAYTTNGATWPIDFGAVWHMSQTNILDSTTNNNTGTAYGNTNTAGSINTSQAFNGINNRIEIPHSASLGLYGSNCTVLALIKVNSTINDWRGIVGKRGWNNGTWSYNMHLTDQCAFHFNVNVGGNDLTSTNMGLADGRWHLVSTVRYTGVERQYVDGQEIASRVCGVVMPRNAEAVRIGAWTIGDENWFNGSMDEIRLSTTAYSSNWMWACWMNILSNSTFSTVSAVTGITNGPVSGITSTSAVLAATLFASNTVLGVDVCWDTNNWGTNAASWAHTNYAGSWTNITSTNISCVVTGLSPDIQYYYKFRATNGTDDIWAPNVLSFRSAFSPLALAAYPYRMKVTFSGYTKAETLTNFPALITLSEGTNGFYYWQLKPTGLDIRIVDILTNELNYEIEQWNTNGTSCVWVQVPQFTNNCSVWMYWGNPNAPVPSYTADGAVWDSNFRGVWHLTEPNAQDYTAYRNNGTGTGNTSAEGKIGIGQRFNNNFINVANPGSFMFNSNISVSTWMKVEGGWINNWQAFVAKNGEGASWVLRRWNNNNGGSWTLRATPGNDDGPVGSTVLGDGQWHYMYATYDGTNRCMYVDGNLDTYLGDYGPYNLDNWNVTIGSEYNGTFAHRGMQDEVRIETYPRSSNWVWACYMNQASNSTFGVQGMVDSVFLPSINNAVGASSVTLDSAILNAMLVSTGGASPQVIVYLGMTDGGTNKSSWSQTNEFTSVVAGPLSTNKSGLLCATTYYYRYYASNTYGECWAPASARFSTSRYKMRIQFVGYDKPETLTNFPASVVFSEGLNGFSHRQCTSTAGGDLRFANSNETQVLNHEIEKWDTNGSSCAWVQVPEFMSNCWIWAYWGGSDTNAPAYTTNGATWSQNFLAVWHLNEPNAASYYTDSTASGLNGLNVGGVPITGLVGGASDFSGGLKYVDLYGLGSSSRNYTFSTWVKTTTVSGDARLIDMNNGRLLVSVGNGYGRLTYYDPSGWRSWIGSAVNDGRWRHVSVTFNANSPTGMVYLDGVLLGGLPYTPSMLGGNSKLACDQAGPYWGHYDGALDEFRIDVIPRSSNWIWACCMNQGSNSVFCSNSLPASTTFPIVDNSTGASNVTMSSAYLCGYLASTGTTPTTVTVYWGATDGGTNKGSWGGTPIDMGQHAIGGMSTNVAGLSCGTTYYYRYYATNSAGDCWAPVSSSFAVPRYRMKIQFSGYDKPETLTNFPALVVLSEGVNGFSSSQLKSQAGGDLRFANSNEKAVLNYEIEKWETNGTSYVWVQVPEFMSNCWIWACWGGSDTIAPAYTTNGATWSQNFLSVWHFNASNSLNKFAASTPVRFDGANYGALVVTGKIGNCIDLNGGTKYVDIAGISSSAGSYTFSYWLNTSTLSGDGRMSDINCGGGRILTSIQNGRYRTYDSGSWRDYVSYGYNDSRWRHAVFIFDGTAGKGSVYVNGLLVSNNITYNSQVLGGNAKIGCEQANPALTRFDGYVDEFQISTLPRSSNWIWACYLNQASNSAFCTVTPVDSITFPVVNNASGASNVLVNSAYLTGSLISTGGAATSVSVYWGPTDGGTNKSSWSNSQDFGESAVGGFSTNVTPLSVATRYYYRYYASNTVGESWAPSTATFMPLLYKMKISFSGYTKDETLTNFPALVVLNETLPGLRYSQFLSSSGGDLRFMNSNETSVINHEIEEFNAGGNSYVWVQVPELTSNSYVWAYWGSGDTNLPAYTMNGATWSAGYAAVWHMNQLNTYDSSSPDRRAAVSYYTMNAGGLISTAQQFNGVGAYVDALPGFSDFTGGMTVSVWANPTALQAWGRFIDFGNGANSDNIIFCRNGGTTFLEESLRIGGAETMFLSGSGIDLDSWQHFVMTFNSAGNGVIYKNGQQVGTGTVSVPSKLTRQNNYIARSNWNNDPYYQGYLDELRISNLPRSSNWIWACYMNQASNYAFNSFSNVVSITMPLISNGAGATNVDATSADLIGNLISTGTVPTTVSVYWGTSDGGTNKGSWGPPIDKGTPAVGGLSESVGSLTAGQTYFYRYYASNSWGDVWAPTTANFTTPLTNNFKMKIYFSGYTKNETLTNFPALVVLDESIPGFRYSQFKSLTGGDLRFANSNESLNLKYEIEQWDAGTVNPSPTNVSGLCLWLKADAGVLTNSSGYVYNWQDQSGNGKNAVQANINNQPIWIGNVLNAKPVLRFDGQMDGYGDFLDTSQLVARTVFAVVSFNGAAFPDWSTAIGDQVYENYIIQGRPGTSQLDAQYQTPGVRYINGTMPYAINNGYDFVPMTSHKIVAVSLGADEVLRTRIGRDIDRNLRTWKGDIAEIIIYNRALTMPEMNAVGLYLGQKYGITTTYTQASGKSYVWVQVPELMTNTCIWASWGNPAETNSPAYNVYGGTWDSSFKGVWHLKEPDDPDSTALLNNGTGNGNVTVPGKIGPAQYFNYHYISAANEGNFRIVSNLTVSAWVKMDMSWQNVWQAWVTKNGESAGWQIRRYGGDNLSCWTLRNTTATDDPAGVTPINDGKWRYVVGTYNGISRILYIDSIPEFTIADTGFINYDGEPVRIGARQYGGAPGRQFIDEARVEAVARSSNWIWACYINQGGGNFTTFDPPMSLTTPIVDNSMGASNVMWTSATANGWLCSTGGAPTSVWLYWGVADGGTNKSGWTT
jgi:hypothetical protein